LSSRYTAPLRFPAAGNAGCLLGITRDMQTKTTSRAGGFCAYLPCDEILAFARTHFEKRQ